MNTVKIVDAQLAKNVHHYRNVKEKLYKTIASIWFNKMCSTYLPSPNYVHVKAIKTYTCRSLDVVY
jgi:hypothetical protein